jgi:6-phosphofructokinase 1
MGNRIGILNGGGDCAGLNAVISSIVKTGLEEGYDFTGIIRGFEGLLGNCECIVLNYDYVKDIAARGGTILKTTNKGRFAAKAGSGDSKKIPDEILYEAKANYDKLGLEALVVIGGDGTLTGALQLQEIGVNIVGVPKTIDNDLRMTDKTFGFSSAVEVVSEALDKLHTTAESHNRVIIVETMGRNAGWIALFGGIAGRANMILIPEIKFSYKQVLEQLRQRKQKGEEYTIIVVAEGATANDGEQIVQKSEDSKENLLGGIADKINQEIDRLSEKDEFEIRTVVLGHLQRGGSPNAEDRILAQRYGNAAMQLIQNRDYGKMVSLQGRSIVAVPIAEAVSSVDLVQPDSEILETAQELGIYTGK